MLHIAICDDEEDFVQDLKKKLEQFSAETGEKIKVTVHCDGVDLIKKYDTTIDLVFLDIMMSLVNGLKVAEMIRNKDRKVSIIFLTSFPQYAVEGYKYQAFDYILKPIRYARLKEEMNNWLQSYRTKDVPYIIAANDTGKYKVLLKKLRYIETANHNVLFHMEQRNIIVYSRMKDIEKELENKGFFRCHTSYIVNLFFVQSVEGYEITLTTGECIPISQPRRKAFMKYLAEYWGNRL